MAGMFSAILCSLLIVCIHGAYTPTPVPAYNYPSSTAAVASHYQSVVRSLDGNSVISSYGKAVETPHSSVRKYDSRVSNDALVYTHLPIASAYPASPYHKSASYVSPIYHHSSPAYYSHSAYPTAYPSSYPASYSSSYPTTYSAAYTPAAVYHTAPVYHAPVYPTPSYHTPSHYLNPYVKSLPVHPHALPYSDSSAVSHLSFEGLGTNYAW